MARRRLWLCEVLEQLESFKPLRGVFGNIDGARYGLRCQNSTGNVTACTST